MHRGAVAEIDLDAIAHNFGVIRRVTEGRPVISVVKADAYGHGAIEVSRRLLREGVSILAVAFTEEAVKLREAGIRSPILVLFDKDTGALFEYDLIPVIHDLQTAKRLSEEAGKRGRPITVHIKIDTGMGRLGFRNEDISGEVLAISNMDYVHIGGLMSHFSDSDIADKSYAALQLERFTAARDALRRIIKNPGGPFLCHMANSAATLSLKDAHMDAVRPGLVLYGYSPFNYNPLAIQEKSPRPPFAFSLRPAMTVKTEILSLRKVSQGTPVSYGRTFITGRESLIAVFPVGYADGYNRAFSNNADVLVRGKRSPVVGRVCMDLTMIDVTGVEGVEEGDEVVLLGRQGNEEIAATEMATKAGTIPYEILTTMGSKSRRVYKN